MNFKLFLLFLILVLNTILISCKVINNNFVKVQDVKVVPEIDGYPEDNCWKNIEWNPIDQVWMEYGQHIDSSDFCARYKLVWSSKSNLIYFLVETVDDVIVDGYNYRGIQTPSGNIYDYDILEVFIDVDNSGGLHVFDGNKEVAEQWGSNAENAFAYHMAIKYPKADSVTNQCVAGDLAGKSWNEFYVANYADHFDTFAVRKIDNKYYWEFALKVYGDSYQKNDPEQSRVILKVGSIIGLSLAYCDNDDINEEPKERDNFIGSVFVAEKDNNAHWMNANGFGKIKLIGKVSN